MALSNIITQRFHAPALGSLHGRRRLLSGPSFGGRQNSWVPTWGGGRSSIGERENSSNLIGLMYITLCNSSPMVFGIISETSSTPSKPAPCAPWPSARPAGRASASTSRNAADGSTVRPGQLHSGVARRVRRHSERTLTPAAISLRCGVVVALRPLRRDFNREAANP